jgi:hypothetical protein
LKMIGVSVFTGWGRRGVSRRRKWWGLALKSHHGPENGQPVDHALSSHLVIPCKVSLIRAIK